MMSDSALDMVTARAHALAQESFLAGSGPGGQNANKVATEVQLRVNIYQLRLAPPVVARLRDLAGSKLTASGELLITARQHRTQDANRQAARTKLEEMLTQAHRAPIAERTAYMQQRMDGGGDSTVNGKTDRY